jgi:hypothetical protein
LSLVLKGVTKADTLKKRRFASISIKNFSAGVKVSDFNTVRRQIAKLAQTMLRFASAERIFFRTSKPKNRIELQFTRFSDDADLIYQASGPQIAAVADQRRSLPRCFMLTEGDLRPEPIAVT